MVVNRTPERAQALAAALGKSVRPRPWQRIDEVLRTASLLVNTTTLGMVGKPSLSVDLATLGEEAVVADIVYTPLETALLAAARQRGHRVVDGLGCFSTKPFPPSRLGLAGGRRLRRSCGISFSRQHEGDRSYRFDRHGEKHRGGSAAATGRACA